MLNVAIVFVLLVLVCIRFFISDENCNWISAINFSGILMAWANIHIDLYTELNNCEKIHFFTGISYSIIAILVVITILVLFGIISFSIRTNDIITLITLLISLPCELHKKILGRFIKRRS